VMILRKLILPVILCSCLCSPTPANEDAPDRLPSAPPSAVVPAQDFDKTFVPITDLKLFGLGIAGEFGTGFCLDPACRFIATNYHVAMIAWPHKIKGEKVVQLYLATGPDDDGATVDDGLSTSPPKLHPRSRPCHLRATPPSPAPPRRSFQFRRPASWSTS
jgi:hypothetical protein